MELNSDLTFTGDLTSFTDKDSGQVPMEQRRRWKWRKENLYKREPQLLRPSVLGRLGARLHLQPWDILRTRPGSIV